MKTINKIVVAAFLCAAISCSEDSDVNPGSGPSQEIEARVTVTNQSMTAWVFTELEGNTASVSLNEANTTITLKVGKRYNFINLGGPVHPLDFRDEDGNYLLTQGDEVGEFEDDEDVDFEIVLDDDLVAFTLTEELADRLATYNCTIHPVMVGDIVIVE